MATKTRKQTDEEMGRDFVRSRAREIERIRRQMRSMEAEIAELVRVEQVAQERLVENVNANGKPLSKRGRAALLSRLHSATGRVSALIYHQHALFKKLGVKERDHAWATSQRGGEAA